MLGLVAVSRRSLVAASGDCSLVAACGGLCSGFLRCRAQGAGVRLPELWHTGLVALRHEGIESVSPALQGGFLSTGPSRQP